MYILRSQKIQIFDPLPPPVHILFTLGIPPWEITFASPYPPIFCKKGYLKEEWMTSSFQWAYNFEYIEPYWTKSVTNALKILDLDYRIYNISDCHWVRVKLMEMNFKKDKSLVTNAYWQNVLAMTWTTDLWHCRLQLSQSGCKIQLIWPELSDLRIVILVQVRSTAQQ